MDQEPTSEPLWVHSPGGWVAPKGTRPGWDWVPDGGAGPRPDRMRLWLRVAYHVPILDRWAHEWMWWRGGFDVVPPEGHMTAEMKVSDLPPASIMELRPPRTR